MTTMMTTSEISRQEIDDAIAGRTIATEFLAQAESRPDAVAVRQRLDDGRWEEMAVREVADRAARVAAGLASCGVGRGDRVVLMFRNVPEFHVADLACVFLGATPVSIYNSSSPDQIQYLSEHCGAKVALLENPGFAERFLAVRDRLPALTDVFVASGAEGLDGVRDYEELLEHGSLDRADIAGNAQPDDLATVIYTSGTTGPPKGVMISHANVLWTVEATNRIIDWEETAGKRIVSYLPMAHIAERAVGHYGMAISGYEVSCCPDPALLLDYLREVRPQLLFGVPRVWEKIHAGLNAVLSADPERKAQFDDGVAAARPLVEKIDWDTATEEERATWDFLQAVFHAAREALGLDQVELAATGAAAIRPDLLEWYRAIGVPLAEVYGMSENTGGMTFEVARVKAGTVGRAVPGSELKLAEDGEVCCRGGHVFQGYLNDPEKTAETIDEDGWLHSGDIGELDDDGYLRIVDRKKELIITAGGKNLSPSNLESKLKAIPLVADACAIGDDRRFVSALVTLDPDIAPGWAAQQGIEDTSLDALATNPTVIAAIEAGLDEVMAEFNNAERVKRITVLGDVWEPDSDVLTPTSKLKRRGIHARYADQIEAMYA